MPQSERLIDEPLMPAVHAPRFTGLISRTSDAHGGGARQLVLQRAGELRARLLARDEQALVELVELMTPWLLGVAQAILRDGGEAEDVVMEAFQIGWDRIGLVQDRGDALAPWLLRITRNRAIDRLRTRRRHRITASRAETYGALGERSVGPEEPNEAAQPGWHVHETIRAAVDALPDDQRTAVHLAFFQGLSQSEIAARLDMPLGTIKTRLRLAFNKLRVSLATVKGWNL